MCRYVGILVFQGLIENVEVFDQKEEAVNWIGEQVKEYNVADFTDSLVWDTKDKSRIDLAFAHE